MEQKSLLINEDLHKRFKLRCVEVSRNMNEVTENLFEKWIRETSVLLKDNQSAEKINEEIKESA